MVDNARAGNARIRAALAALEVDAIQSIAELGGNIDSIVAARQDSNSDDEHDPEGTTLAFERSQSDALLRQAEQRLKDILAARARLEDGTFGACAMCGGRISPGRLEARPYATTCIECAR